MAKGGDAKERTEGGGGPRGRARCQSAGGMGGDKGLAESSPYAMPVLAAPAGSGAKAARRLNRTTSPSPAAAVHERNRERIKMVSARVREERDEKLKAEAAERERTSRLTNQVLRQAAKARRVEAAKKAVLAAKGLVEDAAGTGGGGTWGRTPRSTLDAEGTDVERKSPRLRRNRRREAGDENVLSSSVVKYDEYLKKLADEAAAARAEAERDAAKKERRRGRLANAVLKQARQMREKQRRDMVQCYAADSAANEGADGGDVSEGEAGDGEGGAESSECESPTRIVRKKKATLLLSEVNRSSMRNQSFLKRLSVEVKSREERAAMYVGATQEDADVAMWKHRKGIANNAKVFWTSPQNHDVRKQLLRRGWVENPDRESNHHDLLWCLTRELKGRLIRDSTAVNHFSKSTAITTKAGLVRSLRALKWDSEGGQPDSFFPRAHELIGEEGVLDFEADFRWTAAAAALKRVVREGGLRSVSRQAYDVAVVVCEARLAHMRHLCEDDPQDDEEAPPLPNLAAAQWDALLGCDLSVPIVQRRKPKKKAVLMEVEPVVEGERKATPTAGEEGVADAGLLNGETGGEAVASPDVVGEAVVQSDAPTERTDASGNVPEPGPVEREAPVEPVVAQEASTEADVGASSSEESAGGVESVSGETAEDGAPAEGGAQAASVAEGGEQKTEVDGAEMQKEEEEAVPDSGETEQTPTPSQDAAATSDSAAQKEIVAVDGQLEPLPEDSLCAADNILNELEACVPQNELDGLYNIWIVKPAGKSRGRGIQCMNNLKEILTYTKLYEACPDDKFIAQKYIENPLVIMNRKFDIRQWVLVTDWNPLTVYFYDECYIRFCAEDFTLDDLNAFSHLSNNSIAKHSDHFYNGDIAQGNMWDQARFQTFLNEKYAEDPDAAWAKVRDGMHRSVKDSLKSSKDMIDNRKTSFEIYGYDFVLDEDLNVWLIEINSSPSMEHSTPVTTRLVTKVLDDTIGLVIDAAAERERRTRAGAALVPAYEERVGGWLCIHRSKFEVAKPNYMGVDLTLCGAQAKIHKNKKGKKRRKKGKNSTDDEGEKTGGDEQ